MMLLENKIEISNEELDNVLTRFINILYSSLGNFEDCTEKDVVDITPFNTQCYRIYIQMLGFYEILDINTFFEISTILLGMTQAQNLTKPRVKSAIFHCINLVNKIKENPNVL